MKKFDYLVESLVTGNNDDKVIGCILYYSKTNKRYLLDEDNTEYIVSKILGVTVKSGCMLKNKKIEHAIKREEIKRETKSDLQCRDITKISSVSESELDNIAKKSKPIWNFWLRLKHCFDLDMLIKYETILVIILSILVSMVIIGKMV